MTARSQPPAEPPRPTAAAHSAGEVPVDPPPARPAEVSALEASYRRLLRAYPQGWRHEHGEEMVATLLDTADADGRTRPSPADVADVLVHGTAARLRVPLVRLVPVVREQVAVVALASAGVASAALFVVAEVLPQPFPTSYGWRTDHAPFFGPFVTVGVLLYLPLVLALLAALLGRRGIMRTCLALVVPAVVAVVLLAAHTRLERPPTCVVLALAVLAALAAGGTWSEPARRPLLAASAMVGVVVGFAFGLSVGLVPFHDSFDIDGNRGDIAYATRWPVHAYRSPTGLLDSLGMILPVVVAAGVVLTAVAGRRRPGWSAATLVVGTVWLSMLAALSFRYGRWVWENSYAGGASLLVAGAVLAVATTDLFRLATTESSTVGEVPTGEAVLTAVSCLPVACLPASCPACGASIAASQER